jgi:hypothetical protein
MTAILEQFESLTDQGLQVIPLYPNSKIPMYRRWNQFWNKDFCRSILKKTPRANLGLLLGEIMDVEGDTAEANIFLNDLLKDIPHPCYASSKSHHHLFRNPFMEMSICKYRGIEFRAKNHQSVLPPSYHEDGTTYSWINKDFPIPKLPMPLMQLLDLLPKKTNLKPGHTTMLCHLCKERCFIHSKRLELEKGVFDYWELEWQCQKCRKVDLRPHCKKLRARGYI